MRKINPNFDKFIPFVIEKLNKDYEHNGFVRTYIWGTKDLYSEAVPCVCEDNGEHMSGVDDPGEMLYYIVFIRGGKR